MAGCRKRTETFKEERGSLLFLMLFFSAALMILGAAFLRNSLNERIIAANYAHKIRAHYLAEAGVELALTLLGEQPDYFLQVSLDEPFYLNSGAEEEYFVLQWLEPGNPEGHEEYYTLISSGFYRHNLKNTGAETVIKAFLTLSFGDEDEGKVQTRVALISLSGK